MTAHTKLEQRPSSQWRAWHVAVITVLAYMLVAPILIISTGVPATVVMLGAIAALALQLWKGTLAAGLLQGRAMTITLVLLTLYSLMLFPIDLTRDAMGKFEKEQQALEKLAATDPVVFQKKLQSLDESMLSALSNASPAAVQAEESRRDKIKAAAQREREIALTKRNAGAVKAELATLAGLSEFDRQGQIASYRRLAKLAPAEPDYKRKLAKLVQQDADDLYRIKNPEANVEVLSTKATRGGFGSVFLLDITLKNTGRYAVKDFAIVCVSYAASGTLRDASRTTIYEALQPGQTRSFRAVNLGLIPEGSASTNCSVEGALPY